MSDKVRSEGSWPGDHVIGLDIRSLAAFRLSFATILILDCLIRWWDSSLHYSDLGVLPRIVLLEMGWQANFLSLHMIGGQPWFVHLLFVLQTGLALSLFLGYRTRWATFLSWILLISIHNRNPWLLNGGDVYARLILFWMLFLPWGQAWSVDAKSGQTDQRWWMGSGFTEGLTIRSFAALAVLLQVCLLYWFAALPKTHPSWVGDYSAIDISLHLDHLVKPFGLWFRETFSDYLSLMTRVVFHWEVWGPFLLWFPFDRGQVRLFAISVFAAMHIGFELCFEIGLFPAYCLSVLVVLLPSWFWDRLLGRPAAKLGSKFGQIPLKRLVYDFRRRACEGCYLLLLLYVLCWNFGNEQFRPSLWMPDSLHWIGYTLRLDQRWNMFSPSPPYQDGWWVIKGIRRSGKEMNLLHPDQSLSWDKPENAARDYLTQRRRRWMMELRATESPILMTSFCRYLCWKVNGNKRSLHEVRFVELYYVLEMTEKDGTESEPRRYKVFEYDHYSSQTLVPTDVRLPRGGEE